MLFHVTNFFYSQTIEKWHSNSIFLSCFLGLPVFFLNVSLSQMISSLSSSISLIASHSLESGMQQQGVGLKMRNRIEPWCETLSPSRPLHQELCVTRCRRMKTSTTTSKRISASAVTSVLSLMRTSKIVLRLPSFIFHSFFILRQVNAFFMLFLC